MKKKIIVTGGLGYIGSHTVLCLIEKGFSPIIIDNLSNSSLPRLNILEDLSGRKIPFYFADCRNKNSLRKIFKREQKVEAIIHFAALKSVGDSVKWPLRYYDNNVGGLKCLLEEMDYAHIQKIIFSSSASVYGDCKELPVKENTKLGLPSSPYGHTKQLGETSIEKWTNEKAENNAVSLRYFNPIGGHPSASIGDLPKGPPPNLVPYVTQVAAGMRDRLSVFGMDYDTPDGSCIRDYIHVMDLAEAHISALTNLQSKQLSRFEVFNIGTGRGYSVLEIINRFEKATGKKVNWKSAARREGDIQSIYADCTKAKNELRWVATRPIDKGLLDAWQWQLRQIIDSDGVPKRERGPISSKSA